MDFMVAHPMSGQHGATARDSLGGISKRLFDLAFGSLFLVLTLPILLIAAGALKLAGVKPVFAREPRLGFRGRSFTVVELTTIARSSAESNRTGSRKLSHRTYAESIGAFLHESGIPKLPQLVNVLRGEMSLVGPRALRPSDAILYGDTIAACLMARPGLVQAPRSAKHGDNCAMAPLELDLDYVRNWRFSTDVAALLRTIFTLKAT